MNYSVRKHDRLCRQQKGYESLQLLFWRTCDKNNQHVVTRKTQHVVDVSVLSVQHVCIFLCISGIVYIGWGLSTCSQQWWLQWRTIVLVKWFNLMFTHPLTKLKFFFSEPRLSLRKMSIQCTKHAYCWGTESHTGRADLLFLLWKDKAPHCIKE